MFFDRKSTGSGCRFRSTVLNMLNGCFVSDLCFHSSFRLLERRVASRPAVPSLRCGFLRSAHRDLIIRGGTEQNKRRNFSEWNFLSVTEMRIHCRARSFLKIDSRFRSVEVLFLVFCAKQCVCLVRSRVATSLQENRRSNNLRAKH